MASHEASGSSGISDMEKMMEELGLREEDLDDIVYDKKEAPEEGARWIALAKVNTNKTYSQTWFFKNMRLAWDAAGGEVQTLGRQPVYCQVFVLRKLGEGRGGRSLEFQRGCGVDGTI